MRSFGGATCHAAICSAHSGPERVSATHTNWFARCMGHHQGCTPSPTNHCSFLRFLRISRRNRRHLDPELAERAYSIHQKVGHRVGHSRISARPLVSTFRWPPESWGTQRYAGTLLRSDRDVLRDPVRPCASNLFCYQNALDSLSNPSVHSLSVTLGNHTVHDFQTYNWPCPVGHLPICGMNDRDPYPGSSPQRSAGSVATRCLHLR